MWGWGDRRQFTITATQSHVFVIMFETFWERVREPSSGSIDMHRVDSENGVSEMEILKISL
jgi:hypothetical protein